MGKAPTLGGARIHFQNPQLRDTTKEAVPKYKQRILPIFIYDYAKFWSKLTALLNLLAEGIEKSHSVVLARPSLARGLQD